MFPVIASDKYDKVKSIQFKFLVHMKDGGTMDKSIEDYYRKVLLEGFGPHKRTSRQFPILEKKKLGTPPSEDVYFGRAVDSSFFKDIVYNPFCEDLDSMEKLYTIPMPTFTQEYYNN